MSFFQLILFILAGGIFFIFFKKLFTGDYPKRGIDYEASLPKEQIGGVSSPGKIFSKPKLSISRVEELIKMADDAISKDNMDEATKALQSALTIEPNNIELLRMAGYIAIQTNEIDLAKEYYNKILVQDENDDLAHASLANVLRMNKESDESIVHHKRSIELDDNYAKHYYNYANTLYDMNKIDDAIVNYKKAFELDNELTEAKDMADKLTQASQL
jgi:tetratricopeptide (TPR) repeat protein